MELVLSLVAAVPGMVILVIARRAGWLLAPVARPALPPRAASIAAAAMILGGLAGLALGAAFLPPFVWSSLPEGTHLVATSPTDALVARVRLGAVAGVWLALPGAAALGWLARSRDRSPRAAALFGLVVALGFGAGAALGFALAPAALTAFALPFAGDAMAHVALDGVAAMHAGVSLGLGVAGAAFTGSAAAASRSVPAFKAALALTGAVIAALLFVAALSTPPDVVSQLALAVVLIASWLAGLALAALIGALRRRRA